MFICSRCVRRRLCRVPLCPRGHGRDPARMHSSAPQASQRPKQHHIPYSPHVSSARRCRKQSNVDETLAALRKEGLRVAGCACHVGVDEQRRALVAAAVQVG